MAAVDAVLAGASATPTRWCARRATTPSATAAAASACSRTARSPPAHAQEALGLKRVAIVDWDVHHGNGTQWLTYDDPSVLTISLHQYRNFPPDSGYVEENGKGAGLGANLNVPLPAGSGIGAYVAAFERVVIPALRRFQPELIIVASGLDASAYDPLARQMMTSDGYRDICGQILGRGRRGVRRHASSWHTRAATRRSTSPSAAWPWSRRWPACGRSPTRTW